MQELITCRRRRRVPTHVHRPHRLVNLERANLSVRRYRHATLLRTLRKRVTLHHTNTINVSTSTGGGKSGEEGEGGEGRRREEVQRRTSRGRELYQNSGTRLSLATHAAG
jgi:hypothetical protein